MCIVREECKIVRENKRESSMCMFAVVRKGRIRENLRESLWESESLSESERERVTIRKGMHESK